MKTCPDCHYHNPDSWQNCEICKASLSGVASEKNLNDAAEKNPARAYGAAYGIIGGIVAFVGAVLVYYTVTAKTPPRQEPVKQPAASADSGFSQDPVQSIRRLSEIRLPSEDDIALVLANTAHSDPSVRIEALDTLYRWLTGGVKNIPAPADIFIPALKDASADVRSFAADRLGLLLDFSSINPKAATLVYDDSIKTRLNQELVRLLREPYESVREQAANCAGATRDRIWAEPLKVFMKTDQDIKVRLAAAGALVKYGDGSAASFLLDTADSKDADARRLAAQYLAYMPGDRAETALDKLSRDDPDQRVRSFAGNSLKDRADIFGAKTGQQQEKP